MRAKPDMNKSLWVYISFLFVSTLGVFKSLLLGVLDKIVRDFRQEGWKVITFRISVVAKKKRKSQRIKSRNKRERKKRRFYRNKKIMGNSRERGACEPLNIKRKKKKRQWFEHRRLPQQDPSFGKPRKHPYIKLTGQVSSLYFESLVCRCRKRISCAEE